MKILPDIVKKVAKLANLPIPENEEEKHAEQLSKILDYVDQLNQVDTLKVEAVINISPNINVLDKDDVKESLSQSDALKNAPNSKDGFFVTKGVFEEE